MIDFLDANQVNEFRSKAKDKELDRVETEQYIRTRKSQQLKEQQVGLDIKKTQVESMKLDAEAQKLLSGSSSNLADLSEYEKKFVNARLAGQKALDMLDTGEVSSGPVATRVGQFKEFLGKPDVGTDYRSALNLAAGQLFNALAGTAQSEAELKRLEKIMPKDTDQEATAQRKLQTLMDMLQTQADVYGINIETTTPGLDVGTPYDEVGRNLESPALNIHGEIAKSGDIVYNEKSGSYYNYGDEDIDKSTVFKTTQEGGDVENSFVKWLADSEFLPIAGSIIGGILGSGFASVATGAAGAVVGKSMQQGLRELLDPERQDMSNMATAVLIEGTADALIGGAMFGVGTLIIKPIAKNVAGKLGLKFVIGESAEQLAKQAAGETVEEGIESGVKKTVRDKVARGLSVKPSVEQAKYARSFKGADLVEDLMAKFGIPKSGKALQEAAEASGKEAGEKVTGMLAGKTAQTDDVIRALKEIQEKGVYEVVEDGVTKTVPKADFGTAVRKIDEYIAEVANYGDEIPLTEVNAIKKRLQKSFTKSLETSSLSKELMQDTATNTRKFLESELEKYGKGMGEELANTNKLKELAFMAGEIGERLDQKKAKAFFQFHDLLIGASNPLLLVGKKGVDLFTDAFNNPLTQAKILQTGLDMAVSTNNKTGVRNVLRFMNKLGVSWTAGIGASSLIKQVEQEQPGLDLEQPGVEQQPGFMYR